MLFKSLMLSSLLALVAPQQIRKFNQSNLSGMKLCEHIVKIMELKLGFPSKASESMSCIEPITIAPTSELALR